MINVTDSVKDFFLRHGINIKNETILVAFSGGFDSMCLLHVLSSFLNPKKLIAIHLNHNWRGDESIQDEIRCKNFCNELGVDFYSEKLDASVPKTETAAREARYAFFKKCASLFNSRVVLTAHNANDRAETLIYRITKGSGVFGLASISESRDIFYRPLLTVCREDIEEYCKVNMLKPNLDSSNSDISYNRNFIRHKIFPLLKNINSDVVSSLNSLADIAYDYNNLISSLSADIGNSTQKFILAHNAIKYECIRNLLAEIGVDYDKKKVSNLIEFIYKSSGSKSGKITSLSNMHYLYVNKDIFKIIMDIPKVFDEVIVSSEGTFKFGDKSFIIEKCDKIPDKFPNNSEFIAYVCLDKMNYTLRTRRDGDIIFPFGLGGSQKLKKYLNEKKVPQHEKDKLLLLVDGNEVLWVPGLGISDKIKVVDKVTHVIKLKERL